VYVIQGVIIYYLIIMDKEFSKANRIVLLSITVIGRIFKLTLEAWISIKFVSLMKFLIQKKRSRNKKGLTRFNIFILSWTFLNFGLKALNALFVFTILTIFQYTQLFDDQIFDKEIVLFIFTFTLRTLVIFTDLLNALTILYLYYF